MIFGAQKSDYRAAVDELLDPLVKFEKQLRDCIVPLERMRRARFRSPAKEKEATAYIREAAAKLAPLLAKWNLDGLAEWVCQVEVAAMAVAKED